MISKLGIVGLGYVGLPLAEAACSAGLAVLGLDSDGSRIDKLLQGVSPIDDLSDRQVAQMLKEGFEPTSSGARLSEVDAIVICVPTPLMGNATPDLSAVESAARLISSVIRRGQLVVLESTTYPGTTEEFLKPILESSGLAAGEDFFLAFSPERIDPGNREFGLRNTPKVVGGFTPACTQAAVTLYEMLVDRVVIAKGTREAELSKLLENTFRHLNIALMNEMVRFTSALGIDLRNAIDCAASKPFGFMPFYPGPGVGGHCIPIDPKYLAHHVETKLGQTFRLIELAQEINNSTPAYVVQRAQDLLNDVYKPLRGSTVMLLGVTYKADISDLRESPATEIAHQLRELGARVTYWDPYVPEWPGGSMIPSTSPEFDQAVNASDLVVLLQAHGSLPSDILLASGSLILDTRGVLEGPNVHQL